MGGFELIQPAGPRRRRTETSESREQRLARIEATMRNSATALLGMRHEDGHWCGELTADATLETDYILLQLWLHPPEGDEWNPPSRPRIEKACRAILERQLPDGGWEIFAGGGAEVNITARAYTMLKVCGHSPEADYMRRARDRVLALGGLQAANSYTKINFSLVGLFPRKYTPTVPPEIVLVPLDILYEMSSWSRTIIVPLAIVQAIGPHRLAPSGITVEELYDPHKKLTLVNRKGMAILFRQLDRALKLWERRGLKNVRSAAIREAEHWILDRTRYTEGLGAIYPAMMYTIMAMHSLGYPDDHPDLMDAVRRFEDLILETEDRFQFQPCVSPVWDTAIAAYALGEVGLADPAELTRTADWLLTKEVRHRGDWSVKRPDLEPGGWAFEFANEYYPDIDDTAMVLLALLHARASDPVRQERVEKRAVNWLLGMQSSDGGWAAFDVDCNWDILNSVPFADHNAMLDPSCPDITGRVLESLARRGFETTHPAIKRGVEWLLNHQEDDGSWYGRWGVNYIYGTFLALRGLKHAHASSARPAMQKASEWLRSVQNADGGWGESAAGYRVNRFVAAPSTPSQTAWALLGLLAAGDASSSAVRRGIEYLVTTQKGDGTWDETLFTGTGFPNVFYLQYHLYRNYFPLMALNACRAALAGQQRA
jgi:squalene-hopene/tetraprenyl-beta-curcumene cyclase